VAKSFIPKLSDFSGLKENLISEREAIIKVNGFTEDDDFVRSVADASIVLSILEKIHLALNTCFSEYSGLITLFNNDFLNYSEFIERNSVLETCFLDEYLISEKEMFLLEDEHGELNIQFLQGIVESFNDWTKKAVEQHTIAQKFIKEDFDQSIKLNKLVCQCTACIGDYRAKLRDSIYNECIEDIESVVELFKDNEEDEFQYYSQEFYSLQKSLDRRFHNIRYRLKRSTLNKLESQVKDHLKNNFSYPSLLANKQVDRIKPFFAQNLKAQGLKRDLIDDVEYDRFFKQLRSNLWKNDKFLEVEFKKLVKAVMILKRKDISAKILKDYLGEFWIHSAARRKNRRIIYHMGPTNSGKTYHAVNSLCAGKSGCYLAPLRLLAGELYDTMTQKGVKTTLLTGEEVVEVEGATHYSSTIEMAKFQEEFEIAVIDEIQMITDPQRGWAWTRALVNISADEVHICGDASVLELVTKIVDFCGDKLEIKEYERMTELKVEEKSITVGGLQRSDALIVFSRRNALKYKSNLEQLGFKVSIVYGRLSPEVRREQARKFDCEETDIIVSTDAIAMGMNLPIKRIVFSTISKFINNREFIISPSEIKQIAGRAGRYKRFPTGSITCLAKVENGISKISEAISQTLPQKNKCMVGPDLDIFNQVNNALKSNSLPILKLSEFLRLFNTMSFQKPFYCVDLKEMIEITEMVEAADYENNLSSAEIFGFCCAPVNLGLMEHVQYFVWILNKYVKSHDIKNEEIDYESADIDYLETSIKCVELYQWLSRHFQNKNFEFDEYSLLNNKSLAIEKLNTLLSEKIVLSCSSCGTGLPDAYRFAICENCFKERKFSRRRNYSAKPGGEKRPRPANRKRRPKTDTKQSDKFKKNR